MKSILTYASLLACASTLAAKPLKVYILAGQSNMEGHAKISTLEHLGMSKDTAALNDLITDNGKPRVSKLTHIAYAGAHGAKHGPLTVGFGASEDKFGPELTLGFTIQKQLNEPVLLIKTAWGGKSLHTDFRPPSAPANSFHESHLANMKKQGKDVAAAQAKLKEASGVYYRKSMDYVKSVLKDIGKYSPHYNAKDGYEIAGYVWFQGWNDMVSSSTYPEREKVGGGYPLYSELLTTYIKDVRKDLNTPEMPFVIGVLGVGGPTKLYGKSQMRYKTTHDNFRNAMAAPAEDKNLKNVFAVRTENFWDKELSDNNAKRREISGKINKQAKEQKLDRAARTALEKAEMEKAFSADQLKALKVGISNAEFHYMGSSKVIGKIGEGFAKSLLQK